MFLKTDLEVDAVHNRYIGFFMSLSPALLFANPPPLRKGSVSFINVMLFSINIMKIYAYMARSCEGIFEYSTLPTGYDHKLI